MDAVTDSTSAQTLADTAAKYLCRETGLALARTTISCYRYGHIME